MSNRLRLTRFLEIKRAADVAALREIREAEQERLLAALSVSPASAVADALNAMHDALIGRALTLAEQQSARRGLGAPPVPYAYLLFGSGGRREQTFSSDQDSGMVYANPASEEAEAACRHYFGQLAATVVEFLVQLGYPPCDGNVIASNPEWCLSLAEWENKIHAWFADPHWENVRYLLIVADGRPVAGNRLLAERVKDCFFTAVLHSPVIAGRMIENTLRHKVLVGLFGQLLRERYGENAGGLDVKYGAYIPMVNVLRFMAVQAGIRKTNSIARAEALRDAGVLTAAEAERASSALELFLSLRLQTAVRREGGQWVGSGKMPKDQLTKELARRLKTALKFGKWMQRKVERHGNDGFKGR